MKLPEWIIRKGHFHYVEADVPSKNRGEWRWNVRKVRFLYLFTFQIYYKDFFVCSGDSEKRAQVIAEYYRRCDKEPACFSNSDEEIYGAWYSTRKSEQIILESKFGGDIK